MQFGSQGCDGIGNTRHFCNHASEQAAKSPDFAEHLGPMRRGEQLRQSGFDFVAEINVHARAGVSFLFHAAGSKPGRRVAGEKISMFVRPHTNSGGKQKSGLDGVPPHLRKIISQLFGRCIFELSVARIGLKLFMRWRVLLFLSLVANVLLATGLVVFMRHAPAGGGWSSAALLLAAARTLRAACGRLSRSTRVRPWRRELHWKWDRAWWRCVGRMVGVS